MKLRSWKTVALAATLGTLASFAGAPDADAGRGLVVKRFLLGRLEANTDRFIATGARGTTNAYRDNVVMIVFSAPVNFNSLDNRTVKMGIPAGGNLFLDAEGAFYRYSVKKFDPVSSTFVVKRTYRNRVIFDPTKRQEPLLKQNPYGFEQDSTYTVSVPGIDSGTTKVVRSVDGGMNQRTFTTTFRTTDRYLQDYQQPRILKVEGNDAPGVPLNGRSNVDSRADIIAYFSEPMLPAAFDPNTTFRVYNAGQGRFMSGTIRPSPDGMSFTFRPAFGYGRGPYNIEATLTTALTDRSGNPLDKGIVVRFTTELDIFAPNYDEVVEDFSTNIFEDTSYTATYDKASWNGKKDPGILAGVFGSKSFDITFNNSGGHGIPWWNAQARLQLLYPAALMGATPRTISGFTWRYYLTSTPVGATYNNTTVQMGHNISGSLNTNFTGSYSDTPVICVNSASYLVPTNVPEWVLGPTFTTNWPFNGRDNAVLDINVPSGGSGVNYWRYSTAGPGGTSMIRSYSGTTATGFSWSHDVRMHYLVDRSEARSRWYDTLQRNPSWLDPIVTQTIPPGTVIATVFQGGHENPLAPGTVDNTTLSPWTTDLLNDLTGYRFIRFHTDMTSNLGTATRPTIDEFKFPFIYF